MAQHRIDTNSPEWLAIQAQIEARLKVLFHQLKGRGLPMEPTENARGAILELEQLLEFPNQQHKEIKMPGSNVAEYGMVF